LGPAAHPHFKGAPQRERQKADEDVGFDALGFMMKNGAQAEIAFGDAEGFFGAGKLNFFRF
jgi:hypothetical protein